VKLHLGCGQQYLEGYTNIDFPLSSHSVQQTSVADIHADILSLHYPANTVEEVRLHHVFEHFTRPVACALLASWSSWLTYGGKIHIEVPDFQMTARAMLRPLASTKRQSVAERHIFGSHEAGWAVHCEGYTPKSLTRCVNEYGFRLLSIKKNRWRGIYNFVLIGQKTAQLSLEDLEEATERYLEIFMVDSSESERRLLSVWMDMYREQVKKSWARNE